jgi:hypothetical protein
VNCYRYDYYYRRNPGELRIGPASCGSNFDIYIPEEDLEFGATVVGTTLKWLYRRLSCKSVILLGVDMFGGHWDGTCSGQSGEWGQLSKLQKVIDSLSAYGLIVKSLSDTRLNIPVIDNAQGLQTDAKEPGDSG